MGIVWRIIHTNPYERTPMTRDSTSAINKDGVNKMNVYQLTVRQRNSMLNDVGAMALVVYEHYRQVCRYKDFVITDENVASALGITTSRAKDARLKLEKSNYFFTLKAKTKIINTYIYGVGREGVVELKYLDKLFNLPSARKVRSKHSRDDVCEVLRDSSLKRKDRLDILEALEPTTASDRRAAPGGWKIKVDRVEWERLTSIIDGDENILP